MSSQQLTPCGSISINDHLFPEFSPAKHYRIREGTRKRLLQIEWSPSRPLFVSYSDLSFFGYVSSSRRSPGLGPPLSPIDRDHGSWSVSWHVSGVRLRAHLFFLLMDLFIPLAYPHSLDWIFEKSSQTVLLAQGKCNWVRSHLIVCTHYPRFNPHCTAHWLEWLSQKL